MMDFSSFTWNVLEKYTAEFFFTYILIRIFSYFYLTRSFSFFIFILLKLKFFGLIKFFLKKIYFHEILNTFEKYKSKSFLKYCKNQNYKQYLEIIVEQDSILLKNLVEKIVEIFVNEAFFLQNQESINLLQKEISIYRNEKNLILLNLKSDVFFRKFVHKYLVLNEILCFNKDLRIKDLKKEKTVFKILEAYLFILHDSLEFKMNYFPIFANQLVNGSLKKHLRKEKKND